MDIPRYRSGLEVSPAGGGEYRITGRLEQLEVASDFRAFLPLYVDFGKEGTVRIGTLGLRGNTSRDVDFTLSLPKQPRRVLINLHHDVLARD